MFCCFLIFMMTNDTVISEMLFQSVEIDQKRAKIGLFLK